jgi:flagellar motor component MotA
MDIIGAVSQAEALLLIAIGLSGAVTGLIDTLKPTLFDPIGEMLSEGARLVFMYISRFFISIIFVSMSTQIAEVRDAAPILAEVDNAIIVIAMSLFVILGSEVLHQFADILRAFKESLEGVQGGDSDEQEVTVLRAEIEGLKEARKTDIVSLKRAIEDARRPQAG